MIRLRYGDLLRMPPGSRRTLIAGIALVALILGFGRGIPAWYSWEQQSVEAALEVREAVISSRALRASEAAAADSTAARSVRLARLREVLVSGETPAAASASLAALVVEGARVAGLTLGATDVQLRPDAGASVDRLVAPFGEIGSGAVRLSITLDAEGDAAGLAIFLAWLEESPPALVVRELSVSQSGIASDPAVAEHLRISMTVEGLMTPVEGEGTPLAAAALPGGCCGDPA